jgi:hypothetical protein
MDEIDLARLDEVVRSNIDSLCRNFFPTGRKKGHEWKLADTSGARGDSLGIQLTGPNAGLYHDRATGKGGKFAKLLAENRGVTFPEAVELIERFLGISPRKAQRQNITRSAAPKPFGNSRWKECVKCMTPSKRAELCDYRGYSPEFVSWLVDQHQLIGICKDKDGVERWAFPVHHNGEVAAIHWEIPGENRKNWFYWPRLSELGLKLSPFILGDLSSATEVHIHESQWDLLAQADVLAFDAESQGVALVATLGAPNGALAGVVNKLEAKIYIWPQRDLPDVNGKVASKEWLSKVQSTLERPSYVCWIPDLESKRNFDFNDWRRGRKLSPDDVTQIMRQAESGAEESIKSSDVQDKESYEPASEEENREALERYLIDPVDFPAPMRPEAFHGVAGKIVKTMLPHTEASAESLLLQLLVIIGNRLGRCAYVYAGAKLFPNEYVVCVGSTARGRKGSGLRMVEYLLEEVSPEWLDDCIDSNMQTGEGIVQRIRDERRGIPPGRPKKSDPLEPPQEVILDAGVGDKRLQLVEEEFSYTIKQAHRRGNTLVEALRQAWDSPRALRTTNKNSPLKASDPHVSLIGHCTKDELVNTITEVELTNGFANRILWCGTERRELLPDAQWLDWKQYPLILDELKVVFQQYFANTEEPVRFKRDQEAEELWQTLYRKFNNEKGSGIMDAVLVRDTSHLLKLALIFAILDQAKEIKRVHLEAAWAICDFSQASARWIFGMTTGSYLANQILWALRRSKEGMERTVIYRDVCNRNTPSTKLDQALSVLTKNGLVQVKLQRSKKGQLTEIWTVKK